jgi:hypothetical protein
MFLAFAALLIHPQFGVPANISASKSVLAATEVSAAAGPENPPPSPPVSAEAATPAGIETADALPDAPVPAAAISTPPTPAAFIQAPGQMIISITDLHDEYSRKQWEWRGLAIAASSSAAFDAWTTRRAITNYGAQELNPLLRPFAGNASLYVAMQAGPALMDFAGKKMMYSPHSWMRRFWWVPQSASTVASLFCGGHNLAYH